MHDNSRLERGFVKDVMRMLADRSPIVHDTDFEPLECGFSEFDPYAPEDGVCEDDYEATCPWVGQLPDESPDEERKQGGSPLNFSLNT